jgi:8-oxo-dGTP diphosphatase
MWEEDKMHARQVFAHYDRMPSTGGTFTYCPLCGTDLVPAESGGRLRPKCPACGFVQYRNPAPAVSILISDGERVVLGKRRGEPGRGWWALPSGYVEHDEDYVTTAIREAQEETGLEVEVRSVVNVVSTFVSPRFHFLGIYVVADVVGGELRAGDDLEAVAWFPLAGPLPAPGFPEDACAIEMYAAGLTGVAIGIG